MDHIAIMKKEWKLIPMIKSGIKTVESRWYKHKVAPWDKIKPGDTVFFKNSGELITLRCWVSGVEQYEVRNGEEAKKLAQKYVKRVSGTEKVSDTILQFISGKHYAIFITLGLVEEIKPIFINKKGFGMQSAWLCIEDINQIKL